MRKKSEINFKYCAINKFISKALLFINHLVSKIVYFQAAVETTEIALPPDWPTAGAVEIQGFSMRYRKGLPLSLDNISMDVEPRQKAELI